MAFTVPWRFLSVVVAVAVPLFAAPASAQQEALVDVDAVRTEPLKQTVPVLGRLAERLAIKQNAASFELALINVKDVMEARKEER